ncbi:MAG: phosphoribosyl-ATP diphosphatase [Oscillospiraceae bacterium]|nr:phosphoribosyl-ATP diphosphatase [Oscillospiraceae bacterium]MDD4546628.1 phosphoribosyl-ATP diphosphatase [Oscillospiraceae bacterium]
MNDCILSVYDTIIDRRDNPIENSYTRYLFNKGIDKILKKVGEETAEVLIAAKNGINQETVGEIADLTYHILVLMAQQGIKPEEVADTLNERHKTPGNLKTINKTDKNT